MYILEVGILFVCVHSCVHVCMLSNILHWALADYAGIILSIMAAK